jgi:hypothetical protein
MALCDTFILDVNFDWAFWPFPIQKLTSEIYESVFGHLVGLFGRGINPSQGHYLHRTAQHRKTRTHIHASSGFRTQDPSVRAVEDRTCLRPRGHCDRQVYIKIVFILCFTTDAWQFSTYNVKIFDLQSELLVKTVTWNNTRIWGEAARK